MLVRRKRTKLSIVGEYEGVYDKRGITTASDKDIKNRAFFF